MKKITIIGGGLSGVYARYVLSREFQDAEIHLYEKSARLGGCIETLKSPYFFEKGPRTIKASRSLELLNLIRELDLESDVIYSDSSAKKRYLYVGGKLVSISSLIPRMIPSLLTEWKRPSFEGDETIDAFAKRRFGKYVSEMVFDPMTLGIFAGNSENLSVSACYPDLKKMEQTHGSLTRALFNRQKKPKGLFTLKGGLEVLIERLIERGRGEIHLNAKIDKIPEEETVLAVSASQAQAFFKSDPEAQAFFNAISFMPLTVVNLAFKEKNLTPKGFGYLVPSKEKEEVLGVVFDSSIFPEQSIKGETRLSVMMRSGGEVEAISAIKRHLGIDFLPIAIHKKVYQEAVPQYLVGHLQRVKRFKDHLKKHYPNVKCIGNYLSGVSLNSCLTQCLY